MLGMTLVVGLVPPAVAADPPSDNRLESPMADVAVIQPAAEGSTPDLLVLDAAQARSDSARLSILRRTNRWDPVARTTVELEHDALPARWLVGLTDRRFALIATSSTAMPGTGSTVIVGLEVRDDGGTPALVEVARERLGRAVEYAAPADVDGAGMAELALGLRPVLDASGSCGVSPIVVHDGATLGPRRRFEVPGRLGVGAIGRWDGVPGDDLLAFASPECPPGGSGGARLISLRLRDGTASTIAMTELDVASYPAPLRVRLDDGDIDQAVVWTAAGLGLVDGIDRPPVTVAEGSSMPLVAGPDAATGGGAVRMAWIDADGLHAQRLRREAGGIEATDRTDIAIAGPDPDRWELLYRATAEDLSRHGLSSAWLGSVSDPGCPDLILPGAIMPCGATELRPGAAWLATRPVAAMPIEGRRGVLVAAGLGWDAAAGLLPAAPSPWAAGPEGRWRHGPSTPFALSEIRATDIAYFAEFPVPKATIDTVVGGDGSTLLPGFTGTRMFASVMPLAEGQVVPDLPPTRLDGFREGAGRDGILRTVRVPVPPGNESGRDGSFASLPIGDIRLRDDQRPKRWSIRVIPINDWGEVGFPVVGTVARDVTGPTLAMEVPFTTPVWPVLTSLSGRTEPGSTIRLDGVGEMPIDDRGRFRVETRLAPWPQTLRLTATDASGNASTAEFSVIGGVDYRRFPWALIIALVLLGAVAARGLRAAGRRADGVEATAWSIGLLDDAARPEIEDLPPGAGLETRR